jgi:hypothetical protein
MPVKSFSKVTKHIKEKKKGKINALHENSRDARRLQRASARDDKLAHKVAAREKANLPHCTLHILLLCVLIADMKRSTKNSLPTVMCPLSAHTTHTLR